jgi:RNA polymerase sigma factor (sigma-70 family)
MSAFPDTPRAAVTGSADDLIERYWDRAYRFASMITRNDQESSDIAQEALVKVCRQAARFDPSQGSFESWLWRIVLNVARDAGRAASRRRFLLEHLGRDDRGRAQPDAELLAIQSVSDQELLAAVRRLPKRPRTLIAMRFGADLSFAEIGAQLGLSDSAALMATRRALHTLRKEFESKGVRP